MRHFTDGGTKDRLAGIALLAAILTLALAALGGFVHGHHLATSAHSARVASGWTDYNAAPGDFF
jgi:hypothetical protein